MTKKLVALQIWATQRAERRGEAGQGSIEYVGAIIIAAVLIGIVLTALRANNSGIGSGIQSAITAVFNNK